MPHTRPLVVKVAGRKNFFAPGLLVSVLAVVSALLSPQPMLMTLSVILSLGAGWLLYILSLSKMDDVNLFAFIFPDGSIKLESNGKITIEGIVSGQKWCNSKFSVIRFASGGEIHKLVLISTQQTTGDYRRLMVWFRQDLFLKSDGGLQS